MKTLLLLTIASAITASPAAAAPVPVLEEPVEEIVVVGRRDTPHAAPRSEPMGPFESLNAHESISALAAHEAGHTSEWLSETCTVVPCRMKDPAQPDTLFVATKNSEEACNGSGCTRTDALREEERRAKAEAKSRANAQRHEAENKGFVGDRMFNNPPPASADRAAAPENPAAPSPAVLGGELGGMLGVGIGNEIRSAGADTAAIGDTASDTAATVRKMPWTTEDAMNAPGSSWRTLENARTAIRRAAGAAEAGLPATAPADAGTGLAPADCPGGICANNN